jgi:hypothetical protein
MPSGLMRWGCAITLLIFYSLSGSAVASTIGTDRGIRDTPGMASRGWTSRIARRNTAMSGTLLLGEDNGKHSLGSVFVAFFQRIADSQSSMNLHESRYAYDFIESIHVWTLCLFFGLAVMFDLRLLGWTFTHVPVSELSRRLLPWTIAGFAIMVVTGSLLFYAIPVRSFQSIFFRVKMSLLLLAGLNVLIFHSGVYKKVESWDLDKAPPRAARVAGALSILLWIGIVVSGRMIAYNWFDCDRQPQSRIINFLTNCYPDGTAQQ